MSFRRYPTRAVPEYSPGRQDARANEAAAFLKTAAHLRNITPNGLRCQFNLKITTAAKLIEYETQRRANGSHDPATVQESG